MISGYIFRSHIRFFVFLIIAITLSSCMTEHDDDVEHSRAKDNVIDVAVSHGSRDGHVCGQSQDRKKFCPTDFTRLAAAPFAAEGKEIWILGYLGIDGGQVALFASEEDFLNMEYGRSIQVQGTRAQLESLINEFGYKKTRLKGIFRANSYDDPGNDRLGELLPPVTGRLVEQRNSLEGVQDIKVDVHLLNQ